MKASHDPSRQAALELLTTVRADDAYSNVVWPGILRRRDLSGRDAAFATELAYGTLRWQGFYDHVLASCSSRSWSTVDPVIADVLRLCCHQLLTMRVPDHAAVDSSAELLKSVGIADPGRVGFVNAVARSVAQRTFEQWRDETLLHCSGDAGLALTTSHPQWIVESLRASLAKHDGLTLSTEALDRALLANNTPTRPTVRLRHGLTKDSDQRLAPGTWLKSAAVVESGMPGDLQVIRSRRAIVQDEGSQLAVEALVRAHVDGPEASWLDMCAGPGGKTVMMGDVGVSRGVNVRAVELHAHRAKLVRSAVEDLGVDVVTADARSRPWGSQFFDRILVDVPCTGLGALRRRPEARWRRSVDDVLGLVGLQRELLSVGLSSLRRGGVLAYVTCSPDLRETTEVVEDVLIEHEGVAWEDARALLPEVPDLGLGPHVQLWPHIHGTDAMFIAILRRA